MGSKVIKAILEKYYNADIIIKRSNCHCQLDNMIITLSKALKECKSKKISPM